MEMRANYCGFLVRDEQVIDTEVVSKVLAGLHRGKAVDVAGLTAEHLPGGPKKVIPQF